MNTVLIGKLELSIHIYFGFIGLVCVWLIAFINKRTKTHKVLGYIYLISTFAIMVTSLVRYFLELYQFTNSQVAYLVLSYYLFFSMISVVVFIATLISIWIMANRSVLEEPNTKTIIKSFKFFVATLLFSSIIVGISGYRNSFLLFTCGIFIVPFILTPIYIFLRRINYQKLSFREIEEFHIVTLIKSAIYMHIAFIFGGARIRFFKGNLNVSYMTYFTLVSFLIFSIIQYLWLKNKRITK